MLVECFKRVWTHWERFLVTILAQLQHSRFSSVSMCIEVVLFYIFPLTKEIFYISYIYFLHLRVLTFNVLCYSTTFKGLKSHFSQITIQRLKKILLLMRTMLTKLFFVRLVTFWRFFTCDQPTWIFKFVITKRIDILRT